MARNWFINGPSMVRVKSRADCAIAALSELGLVESPIIITPTYRHKDIQLDAWGGRDGPPAEVQSMLADLTVSMTMIHFDPVVLSVCSALSLGNGTAAEGVLPLAGATLGNNVARFAAGNNYIGLNISSPVAALPWRFFFAYLTGQPYVFPIGAEKSVVTLNWRVIPYAVDPFFAGAFSAGQPLWDRSSDN